MFDSPYEILFKGMSVELLGIAALLREKFDMMGVGRIHTCFSDSYFSFKLLSREVSRLQTIIIRPNQYVVVDCDGDKLSVLVDTPFLADWIWFADIDLAIPDFEDIVWEKCVGAAEVSEEWCRDRVASGDMSHRNIRRR